VRLLPRPWSTTWFRELAHANATLPTWLLLVFLAAGLIDFAAGLAALFAG
jgi:hypothetical protein